MLSSLGRHVLRTATVAVAALCLSCTSRTLQFRIEVKGDASVEEKSAVAQALVTQERWDRLKAQLRAEFPQLTESQLDAHLGVRWDVLIHRSFLRKETSKAVVVSVIGHYGEGFDAARVVAAAVRILEPEVNPRSQPSEPPK